MSLCGEDEEQDGVDGPLRTKARKFKVLLEYGQVPEYIAAEYERAPQLRTPLLFYMPVAVLCKRGTKSPVFSLDSCASVSNRPHARAPDKHKQM